MTLIPWHQSTENITRHFLQWNCCIELFNFYFGKLNNQNINLADRKDCVDGNTARNMPVKMQLLVLAIMLQKGELVLMSTLLMSTLVRRRQFIEQSSELINKFWTLFNKLSPSYEDTRSFHWDIGNILFWLCWKVRISFYSSGNFWCEMSAFYSPMFFG